jgi:hypothetical protein
MNKNVNPVLALAIIIIFGSLFWLKTHFYGKALEVPKVAFLKQAPDNSIQIRLGNKLYNYHANGKLIRIIKLESMGIKGKAGDFDFFSNGDLLINSDEYIRNLKENLASYARKKNTNTAPPKAGKGLMRCNLESLQCQVFNQTIPELQGPHFIHIDRDNDEVYLADTTRHALRKLSASGKLLAELKTGLKFPNQVFIEHAKKGNKLWVVDTNHHAMKALKAETANFGELIETHKTTLDGAWIWPSAFSKMNNKWAVFIADHAMENARVANYTTDWKQSAELNLPADADPVASIFADDKLIIADANHYRLYQFDQYGAQLPNFANNETLSEGIHAALKANKAVDNQYRQWSDWTLYLGIGLFALLFAYAIKQSKEEEAEELQKEQHIGNTPEAETDKIIRLAKLPIQGEWIEAKTYFKYINWIVLGFAVITALSTAYLYHLMKDKLPFDLMIIIALFPFIFLLTAIPPSKISQYKIGFFKNNVTVKTDKGHLISAPYQEIKWGNRFFTIGQWFIPIGNPNQSIFPYDAIQEKLLPYLSPHNKLGEIDALKLQWRSPEGVLKYVAVAIVLAILLILYLKRQSIMAIISGSGF